MEDVCVYKVGEWFVEVTCVSGKNRDSWVNYKAFYAGYKKLGDLKTKRNFWISCNGERLARSSDAMLLNEYAPNIAAYVLSKHMDMRIDAINNGRVRWERRG